jgi:hypothetical protein
MIPKTVIDKRSAENRKKNPLTRFFAFPFFSESIKIGIKLTDKDPSPNNLRKMLGNLNATYQASVTHLGNRAAKRDSLTSPKTRLTSVPKDIKMADMATEVSDEFF